MEAALVIILIIGFVIYLLAKDSNKETKRERYGDAVGKLATGTANYVSDVAYKITESDDAKRVRLAREALAQKNSWLYRAHLHDYNEESIEKMLSVNDKFRKHLEVLGLPEEQWKKIGKELFYIGVIIRNSMSDTKRNTKNSKYDREHYLYKMVGIKDLDQIPRYIKEALNYFDIPEQEWIEYGYSVIDMHNLSERKELKEYGNVCEIINPHNIQFNM